VSTGTVSASRRLVADERTDLVNFLRTLTRDEWEAPSLCEGWRVRDVVAHLLYDAASLPRYLVEAAKAGFSAHRMNARAVERSTGMDRAQLVAALDRSVGGGVLATLVPSLALADVLVHHQDIRRPLNRPRAIPPARVLSVLHHPDPFTSPRRRTHGLRFAATDVSWSRGAGPEVLGTGEAIVMAIAGRPAALDDLRGDGVRVLRTRFGSS
jgi:uncharacterized protein (TIGR03083 family)